MEISTQILGFSIVLVSVYHLIILRTSVRRMNSYSRSAAGRYVASELQIRAFRRPGAAVNDD